MTDERALVRQAVETIEGRKGENIVVIDLSDVSIPTSYFVIADAENPTHVKGLITALREGLPIKPLQSEGVSERKWVVLDYGDIVVHIFDRKARDFYDIDSLWADHIVPIESSVDGS